SGEFANTGFNIPCDTSYIGSLCADAGIASGPGDSALVYILKRNVEGGPRIFDTDTQTYRLTTGVRGEIAGSWSYDAYYAYGATHSSTVGHNDLLISHLASEITGCDPSSDYGTFTGCVPYDVWHNNVSREAALAASGTSFTKTDTQLNVLSAYATGNLGFGLPWANGEQLGLVVGAEHRVTKFGSASDNDSLAGNFSGAGSASLNVNASEGVYDYFGEMALPLYVNDGTGLNRIDGSLGYRHSDYDLSGGSDTYKAGLSAAFLDNKLLVRSGYNRAIRAPSLNDLYFPAGISLDGTTDYCAGANPTYTQAQCEKEGVPASQYGKVPANPASQYYGLTGGNVDLTPEVADTYTFGVAYEPITNLNLAVDWYNIKIKNAISSIGYDAIQQLCADQNLYCDLIHRNTSNGRYDLWLGSPGAPGTGYINDLAQNVGLSKREGIDFNASYGFNLGPGRVNTRFVGSYTLKDYDQPLADVSSTGFDCKGKINSLCNFTTVPKWRHVANVRYSFDRYSVNLRWRYIGSLSYEDAYTGEKLNTNVWLTPTGGIGSYSYFDLSGNVNIGPATWTIGVNNIADRSPPFVGSSGDANNQTSNSANGYDQVGRYFFTSVSFRF
ncbi:MAG: TonB-dependent receptor, partial [Rudaea sp.]